jgi:GST-like protein
MIELYHSLSPNVQKIHLMLAELGLPYRTVPLNIWRGEQFDPAFLALNPNAKLPLIVEQAEDGGAPLVVFESGAILIHLAERHGRFLPTEPRARAEAMQWLMIQLTGIGPMCGQLNHFMRHAKDEAYAITRYATEAARLYRLMDDRLAVSEWLGGAEYGIADIATFPWVHIEARILGDRFPFLAEGAPDHPALWRWHRRILERPAVQVALDEIARYPSNEPTATPDDKDRLFGRGQFAHPAARALFAKAEGT